ncbi:hemagglutinin/hemolysin-related protein [Minicystis rosea]|nr:hemagglutinin/hemolysin-related protein [Minicystis rosea]
MRTSLRQSLVLAVLAAASCFNPGARWDDSSRPHPPPPVMECAVGAQRCALGKIEHCDATADGGTKWNATVDCAAQGLICSSLTYECKVCIPDADSCNGQDVMHCSHDGLSAEYVKTCDTSTGDACRDGLCLNLCTVATVQRSNVGCEYWAVDLDNAMINATSNAAAQQFAVVISNAQPDVPVSIHVYQDDGNPGDPPAPTEIANAIIAPYNLQVFKLGPREVDGSPPGQYNTGTHTAITRHAYKITTDFPVVAYQFNPLDNVNVFSNDASLLKPREALAHDGLGLQTSYVVAGWPQTIAATDDPDTNFNPTDPIHLRAFLTIVGTHEDTKVRVIPKTTVVGGGPVATTPPGGVIETTLHAFDVLNLETGDFNADFTGTLVESDQAVVVFSGNEASDAPHFETLSDRRCCADHMEDQLDPLRTAGRTFAIAHNPSRTRAVKAAGADLVVVGEPDFVRFVSASAKPLTITTTLPPPNDTIHLQGLGDMEEVTAYSDFMAQSTEPVLVAQIMASQDAAGVKRGLPGGDPSLLIYPPTEQFRLSYVFLTPDKYAFDFVVIVAPLDAHLTLDGIAPESLGCEVTPADGLTDEQRGNKKPPFVVYNCQLSFPQIDPLAMAPDNVKLGMQNDGVHRVEADQPVGVIVSGFDSYVSYAYAGGTDLKSINIPK